MGASLLAIPGSVSLTAELSVSSQGAIGHWEKSGSGSATVKAKWMCSSARAFVAFHHPIFVVLLFCFVL